MTSAQMVRAINKAKHITTKNNQQIGKSVTEDHPITVKLNKHVKGNKVAKDEHGKPITKEVKTSCYSYKDFKAHYSVVPKLIKLDNGSSISTTKAQNFLKQVLDLYNVKSIKELPKVLKAIKASRGATEAPTPDSPNGNTPFE